MMSLSFDDLEFESAPARARGPIQSQLTLASLGKDTSMKKNIARAVVMLSAQVDDGLVSYRNPVTDDGITAWIEKYTQRRQQRNVIARTRGLMEKAGWFDPVPDVIGRTGRPTHAIVPSSELLRAVEDEARTYGHHGGSNG